MRSRQPVVVEDLASLQIVAGRWPQPVERALLAPITAPGYDDVAAILVLGLSPRLVFDGRYQSFLEQAGVYLGQALTNARAYDEERRRAEALAEIDRAKTTFFSNVSHEFRTPLTLLLGPLEELLADPGLSAEARTRLELAHRNSLRLLKLVNSLLDFSRLEAGKVRASYEPVNLAALHARPGEYVPLGDGARRLEFEVDCPPLQQPVYVDREMWEKIVLNLLSNAFKFTLSGRVTLRLRTAMSNDRRAAASRGHRRWRTGRTSCRGLFDRFHRVESTHGRTHEGSGIGLALVQELVRLHGGTIRLAAS